MAKTTLTFSLDDQADRDVLAFFGGLPRREKSKTFRTLVRAYVEGANEPGMGSLTLGDLYQVLVEIKALLKQGARPATDDVEVAAPADPLLARVEDALSELGL